MCNLTNEGRPSGAVVVPRIYRSLPGSSTGLTSTTGVRSNASRFRTCTSGAVDGQDRHPVQPQRVRPIGRTGVEDTRGPPGKVAARVHDQHIAARPVEPSENQHLATDAQITKTVAHARFEDQPGIRRSLVALQRSLVAVHQRRLATYPDGPHHQRALDHASSSPTLWPDREGGPIRARPPRAAIALLGERLELGHPHVERLRAGGRAVGVRPGVGVLLAGVVRGTRALVGQHLETQVRRLRRPVCRTTG